MNHAERIQQQLERARMELLDLSLRNPLLNHRVTAARGLEIVDERAAEVFRMLVLEGKRMRFQPASTRPERRSSRSDRMETTAPQFVKAGAGADSVAIEPRQRDKRLTTPYRREELEKRLRNTAHDARRVIEEQGANVCYLAIGMLHWFEALQSEMERRAPLLLIPVVFERRNVTAGFQMRYDGSEIGTNLSLAARLEQDLGVRLPELMEENDPRDLELPRHFASVARAVESLPRWRVAPDEMSVGFFSFGRFLMFRDLDGDLWPDDRKPWNHPLITDLLVDGFRERPSEIRKGSDVERLRPPGSVLEVLDADHTQASALADVAAGRNLVVQGPPGTGKSQTIANMIAEAVGAGQRVLFVAEKMAALDVVKRRLDEVGLGDTCLELHSDKASKRVVLDQIKHTLSQDRPRVDDSEAKVAGLEDARRRLEAYCLAVNEPVQQASVTPHQAIGYLLQFPASSEDWPRFPFEGMASWDGADYRECLGLVAEVESKLVQLGSPQKHPFWGATIESLMPSERDLLSELLDEARRTAQRVMAESQNLGKALSLLSAPNVMEMRKQLRAAEHMVEAPTLEHVNVASGEWTRLEEELRSVVEAGTRFAALRSKFDERLIPEAWEQEMLASRQALAAYGRRWWRFFVGRYRAARFKVVGVCRGKPPRSVDELLELADAVLEAQRNLDTIRAGDEICEILFGKLWKGSESDWDTLGRLIAWVKKLHALQAAGEVPPLFSATAANAASGRNITKVWGDARRAMEAFERSTAAVDQGLRWDAKKSRPVCEWDVAAAADRLRDWDAELGQLQGLTGLNYLLARCRERGIGEVGGTAETWADASEHLTDAFRRSFYLGLLDRAFETREALAHFDSAVHEQLASRFRTLDRAVFGINRAQVALAHWNRLPSHSAGGQLGVLRRELEKKTRHMAIRRLLREAGRVVQTVKPVFMMSPLSIAKYLAPDAPEFDLVVFDEASQVRPADAFGALLRAKQLVVVGDSRQLPPTNFFDRLTQADDDPFDEGDEETAIVGEMESILALCLARGVPDRMLRWHYRSRHPSLIDVSNEQFYDGRLVVFPSPEIRCRSGRDGLGLVLRHYPETIYDAGGTRCNVREAALVAESVMNHARSSPELSLGVAAFSAAQRSAIELEVERLRRTDPSAETFFDEEALEPFFVKNLENVQGDERDVILISVGYGRTAKGKVPHRFGPLNMHGGERRLNVLITRARRRCEVFTNILSSDIDLSRTRSEGVAALKAYLEYAEFGPREESGTSTREPPSPFEEVVRDALVLAGHDVETKIGESGVSVDIAVRDPQNPDRFLLGILCDGRSYLNAASVRDRDHLRPLVLSRLGWRIHRVWSADWFHSPESELGRAIKAALRAQSNPEEREWVPDPAPIERDPDGTVRGSVETADYEVARLAIRLGDGGLDEVSPARMAQWALEVLQVESPIHEDELARRIVEAAGVSRVGSRIQATIDAGLDATAFRQAAARRGEFFWLRSMLQPPIRDRANAPPSSRRLAVIAPEELKMSLIVAVEESYAISQGDAIRAALRHLGFRRTSDAAEARMTELLEHLIREQRLLRSGRWIVAPEDDSAMATQTERPMV